MTGEQIIVNCMTVNKCVECRKKHPEIHRICTEYDLNFNFDYSEKYNIDAQLRAKGYEPFEEV